MKAGIYCIENLTNKKCYVGASKNIASRLYDHKRALKSNRHCNSHLQNSFNLYGEENFKFYAIEYCEFDEKLLNQKEGWWVRNLGLRNPDIGYNESDTFYGDYPIIKTAEHKAKLRESSKIKVKEYYDKQKAEGKLQVVIIHLETEIKEYYPCMNDVPYNIKNKKFNFEQKVFRSFTHNKTEKQIQEEFKAVQLRYQNYLKSQTKTTPLKQPRKYVDDSKFEFTSKFETLTFNSAQEAASYFSIGIDYIQDLHKIGTYTKTMFYLVGQNGIINEAKDLKTLASQNNHNYNAYKKLMEGRYKTYLGHIIHRNDMVFEVQRLS